MSKALRAAIFFCLATLCATPAAAQWATPPTGYAFDVPAGCPMAWKRYDACADQMQTFAAALERARRHDRKLLVVFGADWCPWCRSIDANLQTAEYLRHPELADRIEVVNIAVSALKDGRKVRVPSGIAVQALVTREALLDTANGGIPFFALVDPDTDRLAIGISNGRFATLVDDRPANLAPEFRSIMSKGLGAMDAYAAAKAKKQGL